MGFTKFIEIGRVCTINKGNNEGKLVIILDIMNLNRVLVEGATPSDNLPRQILCIRHLTLTENKVSILRGMRSSLLHKSIKKEGLLMKHVNTRAAVKLER